MKLKTIFLTGATGFIGSYFARYLLDQNFNLICLSRTKQRHLSLKRVLAALNYWCPLNPVQLRRLKVIDGDVSLPRFGLRTNEINFLCEEVSDVFHCAALTSFFSPIDQLYAVNVKGTENLLKLCKILQKSGRLRKLNHMSTAYVCGDFQGVFTEQHLNEGQDFLTNYEKSKYEAELMINDYRRKENVWVDIFRPPLVVGECPSGRTPVYQSLFQAIHLLNEEIFEVFPAKGIFCNLINIDILSKAIFLINERSDSRNQTYHVFGAQQVYFEDIIRFSSARLNFKCPQIVFLKDFDFSTLSPVKVRLLKNTLLAFNPRVRIDPNHTVRILSRFNFEFPKFNEHILAQLLDYAKKTGFLK